MAFPVPFHLWYHSISGFISGFISLVYDCIEITYFNVFHVTFSLLGRLRCLCAQNISQSLISIPILLARGGCCPTRRAIRTAVV
jgi:hypothetical protein